jgi:hypothetical protein
LKLLTSTESFSLISNYLRESHHTISNLRAIRVAFTLNVIESNYSDKTYL